MQILFEDPVLRPGSFDGVSVKYGLPSTGQVTRCGCLSTAYAWKSCEASPGRAVEPPILFSSK